MTQLAEKRRVAQAAADYIATHLPEGGVLGVGTGSTANCFIEALAPIKSRLGGAVASSEASKARLLALGIPVIELNDVEMPFSHYVDGADEIDLQRAMIKGGGGALTREKIVASAATTFVCIADASKAVAQLGRFPLPIEVIPMAANLVARQLVALGGRPKPREGFVTDNGNLILDVEGLVMADPAALESRLNQIPGVVDNGLFALRRADVLFLGTKDGVRCLGEAGGRAS